MASATQMAIREVLRTEGPLAVEDLMARLPLGLLARSKNPKQTVRNVLGTDQLCESASEGHYVYLPGAVNGACQRLPMDLAAPERGLLAIGVEVYTLLWPMAVPGDAGRSPTISLPGGLSVAMGSVQRVEWRGSIEYLVSLPQPFWQWWSAQPNGVEALRLCCDDGQAGHYTLSHPRDADLDGEEVARRNAEMIKAAASILKRTRGMSPDKVARRLLALGLYHGNPLPDPLRSVLLQPTAPFVLENMQLVYRPELSPTLRRLLAPRLGQELIWSDTMVRDALGLPASPPLPTLLPDGGPSAGPLLVYSLRVRLQWQPSVWRVIEMTADQTLEDLHEAIQDAFGWDRDHLYAFFLSGRAWDSSTEIGCPSLDGEMEPPTADEVTLGDLDPQPGQRLLYLFDFGDDLRHDIEVLGIAPPSAEGQYPRIAETHGAAPPQYPVWDEDEDADNDPALL